MEDGGPVILPEEQAALEHTFWTSGKQKVKPNRQVAVEEAGYHKDVIPSIDTFQDIPRYVASLDSSNTHLSWGHAGKCGNAMPRWS